MARNVSLLIDEMLINFEYLYKANYLFLGSVYRININNEKKKKQRRGFEKNEPDRDSAEQQGDACHKQVL